MKEIEKLFTENPLDSDIVLEKVIELGIDFIGGDWKNAPKNDVSVSRVLGGQSNHMFHVKASATPYLLRIHKEGQNQFSTDIVNFSIFSDRGLGPKLYGFFDGGRMEEFLPSKTLNPEDVLKPEISKEIGQSFSKYHAIEMPLSKRPHCFQIMRDSLKGYRELGGGDYNIFPTNVTYADHPKTVSIDGLQNEIDKMEQWSNELFADTLVFCHNDLTCANILQLNSTNQLVFIDWEYACYNFRGYDLAMHLSESAILRMSSPPGIQINEEFTDNHPNLRGFCEAYVEADKKLHNSNSTVDLLVKECEFFWPITHLFWACIIMKLGRMECNKELNMDIQARDRLAVYFHLRARTEAIYKELKKEKNSS
ncbi:unnamed protein product [Caenorhabditis brenneri]